MLTKGSIETDALQKNKDGLFMVIVVTFDYPLVSEEKTKATWTRSFTFIKMPMAVFGLLGLLSPSSRIWFDLFSFRQSLPASAFTLFASKHTHTRVKCRVESRQSGASKAS